MALKNYYEILGLPLNASITEIKKAYRIKARLYHPDINPSPEARDLFISVTEAYDFLLSNHDKFKTDEEAYRKAMDNWRKYRQNRSNYQANAHARQSYIDFKKSKLYKSSRIFDRTIIIYSFVTSLLVIVYTIFGYTYRLNHPIPDEEKPKVSSLIMMLSLGLIFFIVSFIYLKAYLENSKKHKEK
jgi:curved DNA-binding protein CbpA